MSVRHQAVRCPYLSPIFEIDLLPYLVKAGLRTDAYRCRCRLVIYTNHISPIFPPGSSLLISFSASPFVRGWILQICNVRSCYPARHDPGPHTVTPCPRRLQVSSSQRKKKRWRRKRKGEEKAQTEIWIWLQSCNLRLCYPTRQESAHSEPVTCSRL